MNNFINWAPIERLANCRENFVKPCDANYLIDQSARSLLFNSHLTPILALSDSQLDLLFRGCWQHPFQSRFMASVLFFQTRKSTISRQRSLVEEVNLLKNLENYSWLFFGAKPWAIQRAYLWRYIIQGLAHGQTPEYATVEFVSKMFICANGQYLSDYFGRKLPWPTAAWVKARGGNPDDLNNARDNLVSIFTSIHGPSSIAFYPPYASEKAWSFVKIFKHISAINNWKDAALSLCFLPPWSEPNSKNPAIFMANKAGYMVNYGNLNSENQGKLKSKVHRESEEESTNDAEECEPTFSRELTATDIKTGGQLAIQTLEKFVKQNAKKKDEKPQSGISMKDQIDEIERKRKGNDDYEDDDDDGMDLNKDDDDDLGI